MKLTNYQRDAFIRAVMQDIPEPNHEELVKEAQAALVKAMSADVRKVYRNNPKALRSETTSGLGGRMWTRLVVGDADFDTVIEPFLQKVRARDELRQKLKGVAYGVSTLKQLREALPELVKYMPTEAAPVVSLPAVANLVADMVKQGWKPA